jgi:hypothetical protein
MTQAVSSVLPVGSPADVDGVSDGISDDDNGPFFGSLGITVQEADLELLE